VIAVVTLLSGPAAVEQSVPVNDAKMRSWPKRCRATRTTAMPYSHEFEVLDGAVGPTR
jgi:hypothetical protein